MTPTTTPAANIQRWEYLRRPRHTTVVAESCPSETFRKQKQKTFNKDVTRCGPVRPPLRRPATTESKALFCLRHRRIKQYTHSHRKNWPRHATDSLTRCYQLPRGVAPSNMPLCRPFVGDSCTVEVDDFTKIHKLASGSNRQLSRVRSRTAGVTP